MYIVEFNDDWIPPKDLDNGYTILFEGENLDEYFINFYYATLVIIGADLIPVNEGELLS
jgi:hypothetical protein